MRVATKTVTVVRTDMSEDEWALVRQLVAEGLTVVEQITPAMQAVAEALHLNVAAPDPGTPPVASKTRSKKSALPTGGDP